MTQSLVRLIFDKDTFKPTMFVIPHTDAHLAFHLPGINEKHIDVTNAEWCDLQTKMLLDNKLQDVPHLEKVERFIKSKVS